ncbi:hypothetical protein BGU24_12240 [Clostridioides difficile]|nr:hypothetical protein BGU24_12240 [Clostridioides difficile]
MNKYFEYLVVTRSDKKTYKIKFVNFMFLLHLVYFSYIIK